MGGLHRKLVWLLVALALGAALPAQAGVWTRICKWAELAKKAFQTPEDPIRPKRGSSGVESKELRKLLKGGDKGDLYDYPTSVRNAISAVLKVGGPSGEIAKRRAALMMDLFSELQSGTGRGWNFLYDTLPDGSYSFRAPDQPKIVVIRAPGGEVYVTTTPKTSVKEWTPDYDSMKPLRLPEPPKKE